MHDWVRAMARGLALTGGMALIAMTVIVCLSVTGRALVWAGLSPIHGDYEMVEALAAIAVFAFLPWCQLNRGHASVDVFTNLLPRPVNRVIDIVSELAMTGFLYLITARLVVGTMDKVTRGDFSYILQYPTWWLYAACLACAAIACLVSTYVAWAAISGRIPYDRARAEAAQ